MISINSKFPDFSLPAVSTVGFAAKTEILTNDDIAGQWCVMLWYPADFTPVCNSELLAVSEQYKAFVDRGVKVLGASADSAETHKKWLLTEQMSGIQFPLMSDEWRDGLCDSLGIIDASVFLNANVALVDRATFIINPEGIIRWICVNDANVGRSIPEILRVIDALQTNEMCPCNWGNGNETLTDKL